MGNSNSSNNSKRIPSSLSKSIDEQIKIDALKAHKEIKILLLGTFYNH